MIYANLDLHGLDMLSNFAVQSLHVHGLKQTLKAWCKKYWWNTYFVGKVDEAHDILFLLIGTDICT
jgi:hypothetical protein